MSLYGNHLGKVRKAVEEKNITGVDRSHNKNYLYVENSDTYSDAKTLNDFYQQEYSNLNKDISEYKTFEHSANKDMVNHPEHYNKGKYETYDVIVDTLGKHEAMSYCQGNILKYIMRMWNKDKPLQDAEKAEWYLKAMIKLLKETKGVNW